MDVRLSYRERAYLNYLKKVDSDEYRGSWQQVIRHIIDKHMIADEHKDDNPFKFNPETDIPHYHKNNDDASNVNSDNSDADL